MKEYDIHSLRIVEMEENDKTIYLICKYNKFNKKLTEIFTNEHIKESDVVNTWPFIYLGSSLKDYFKNNNTLKLDKKILLKIYTELNNDDYLCEKQSNVLDITGTLEKATIRFFPKTGDWYSTCFEKPNELVMTNLPCHLRDDVWLSKMLKKYTNLFYFSHKRLLKYVKNSEFFKEKRHEYELEIVKWQIEWIMNGGGNWVCNKKYGSDLPFISSDCDLMIRNGILTTLSAIGMDKEVIEEGIEKNTKLWRNSLMEMAYKNEYNPIFYGLEQFPIDLEHKEKWLKMRKYEYYLEHNDVVDKYGTIEPEMTMTDEEVLELKTYLSEKNPERREILKNYEKEMRDTAYEKNPFTVRVLGN